MNILIIGSGGREHALALKISESKNCSNIYVSPGNGGTDTIAENVYLELVDEISVYRFCKKHNVELVVIGPEQPLVDGLANILREHNINVFGPSKEAAEIEGNKKFAKELMDEYNIPTAKFQSFSKNNLSEAINHLKSLNFPIVLKASGLAAGKGVIIANSFEEAQSSLIEIMKDSIFGSAGDHVVIEEFLEGEELSVFAITDGEEFVLLPASQDHKKIGEGDSGKNTGGMGAYAPLEFVNDSLIKEIEQNVIIPTLIALKGKNRKFNGCLYCGLINTASGIKVIEFNCRFGDPEIQVVLPLLEGDFLELLYSASINKLKKNCVQYSGGSSLGVVLVSGGYPDSYEKGYEITGLNELEKENLNVIHAGTIMQNGKIRTNGGRVLNIISYSKKSEIKLNKQIVYQEIDKVKYQDIYFRKDIGYRSRKS